MIAAPPGTGRGAAKRQRQKRVEFRIRHDRRVSVGLRPVHRLHVERRVRRKPLGALAGEGDDLVLGHRRLQPERGGGAVDARAMAIDVRHDALEGPRSVEDARAEPCRMSARPHERRIALMPAAVEPGPGFGIPRQGRHPSLNLRGRIERRTPGGVNGARPGNGSFLLIDFVTETDGFPRQPGARGDLRRIDEGRPAGP